MTFPMAPAAEQETLGGFFDCIVYVTADVANSLHLLPWVNVIKLQRFQTLVIPAYRAGRTISLLQLLGDPAASLPVSPNYLLFGTGGQEVVDTGHTARNCLGDGFIAHPLLT